MPCAVCFKAVNMEITPHIPFLHGLLLVLLQCLLSVTGTWKGEGQPLEYFILEEVKAGTLIGNVAIDYKLTDKFNETVLQGLTYSIDREQSRKDEPFTIDSQSGIVGTMEEIDRDALCPGNEACIAWLHINVSPSGVTEDINILLEIVDINDNPPVFLNSSIQVTLPESAPLGTTVDLPTAIDVDSGNNGVSMYELVSDSDLFALDESKNDDVMGSKQQLRLMLVGQLDREYGGYYMLSLVAHDGGAPSRSGSMMINVTVADVNDHDPRFDNATYMASIQENGHSGELVATVKAHDFDIGTNAAVTYAFDERTAIEHGNLFSLDPMSGRITTKKALDFEERSTYLLIVRAHDSGLNSHPGEAVVVVRVVDENDNQPIINLGAATLSPSGEVQVPEDAAVGTNVAQITVSDMDGGDNGRVYCDMRAPATFMLRKLHQGHFRLVTTDTLDRETREEYVLRVICRDLGATPNLATLDVVVRITDVNDNAPMFSESVYSLRMPTSQPLNSAFLEVHATDPDAGNSGQIRYSIHSNAADRFSIHPTSGAISMKMHVMLEKEGQIRFRVVAADMGTPSRSSTATVLLTSGTAPAPPKFSQPNFEFGIFENLPSETDVGMITLYSAEPKDYTFTLESKEGGGDVGHLFAIDSETAAIKTKTSFDREEHPAYYLLVRATHRLAPNAKGSVSVTVYIADKNDNGPVLHYPTAKDHTIHVAEHAAVGTKVATVHATDPDLGSNGKLTYTITDANDDGNFQLDPISGVLTVARDLRQSHTGAYNIKILVTDGGYPRFMTSASLEVRINQTSVGVGPEVGSVQQENVVDPAYATVVVAVTAASLITVFLVLFGIMIYLLWRRMVPQSVAKQQQQPPDMTDRYCYSNMEAGPDPTMCPRGSSAHCHAGHGKTASCSISPPPQDMCGYLHPGPSSSLHCANAAGSAPKSSNVKNTDFCLSIDCEKTQKPYVENNVLLQGDSISSGPPVHSSSSRDRRGYTQNALCTTPGTLVMPDAYDDRELDSDESFIRTCTDSYNSET